MVPEESKAPIDEQKICVTCGFCCDGTLFRHAMLKAGEQGSLPEKIEQNYRKEKDKEFFLLPCHYFNEKCTIYDQKRAKICSGYRCQLLKDFEEKKVSLHDALESVAGAMKMRAELMAQYQRISGNGEGIHFRQLLIELGRVMKSAPGKEPAGIEYDLLLAWCNIFEALLIKHFRSAEDFDKMTMK
ncbi:MAG: hypothetical protein IH593_10255 [Bacteroidales bacterium]|nr:hypothetical protein [Bacteroidales bacterium]